MKQNILQQIGMFVIFIGLVFGSLSCDEVRTQLLYRQAQNAHNAGHYDRAISLYKEILKIRPDNSQVYHDMAVAYLDKRDFAGAQKQIMIIEKMGYPEMAGILREMTNTARKR